MTKASAATAGTAGGRVKPGEARRTGVLARVAVPVRAAARTWWWLGVGSAAAGACVPGLAGRRTGLIAGAVAFVVAAAAAFLARRAGYARLAGAAARAGMPVILQDRAVTVRGWRRSRHWWLTALPLLAVAASAALPAAGGLLLAGAGAGLWLKAVRLGRWERAHGVLLWTAPDPARRSPATATTWLTTGPAAGDARPGGAASRRTA